MVKSRKGHVLFIIRPVDISIHITDPYSHCKWYANCKLLQHNIDPDWCYWKSKFSPVFAVILSRTWLESRSHFHFQKHIGFIAVYIYFQTFLWSGECIQIFDWIRHIIIKPPTLMAKKCVVNFRRIILLLGLPYILVSLVLKCWKTSFAKGKTYFNPIQYQRKIIAIFQNKILVLKFICSANYLSCLFFKCHYVNIIKSSNVNNNCFFCR